MPRLYNKHRIRSQEEETANLVAQDWIGNCKTVYSDECLSPNSSSLHQFFNAFRPARPTQFRDLETILRRNSVNAMERIEILTSAEHRWELLYGEEFDSKMRRLDEIQLWNRPGNTPRFGTICTV